MKKIINLTINEIAKQSGKISFLVASVCLIMFAVLTPIVYKNTNHDSRFKYTVEYGGVMKLGYTNFLEHLGYQDFEKYLTVEEKESDDYKEFLEVKNFIPQTARMYENIEVIYSSYRNEIYKELIEKQITLYVYTMCIENEEIKNNEMIYEHYKAYLDKTILNADNLVIENEIKILQAQIEYMNDIVVNNNYNKYIDFEIWQTEQEIIELASKPKSKSEYDIKKYMLEIYKEIDDDNIAGYENEYKINYLNDINNHITYALGEISDKDYSSKYKDKEEYYEVIKQSQKRYLEESEKLKYAVINGIDYYNEGIRDVVEVIISNIKYITIFVLAISCVIVTSEFDKGSVRLLVTKPNKRWKIMLSKILSIVFYSFVFTIVYVILSLITSMIIYGVNDLSIPMVEYGKDVYVTNYAWYIIKYTLLNIPTLIFFGMFSLCLSTIFKNSIFPMILSIALLFLSALLVRIVEVGFGIFTKILFIVHINLYNLMSFPNIVELEIATKTSLSLGMSILNLIIYSIIFGIISILLFNKKDIEN